MTFDHHQNLQCHIESEHSKINREHTQIQPFEFVDCQMISEFKDNNQKHLDGVQEKLNPFKCALCQKTYSAIHDLQRHIETVHSADCLQ